MNNEIMSGIGGAILGALGMQAITSTQECISTPLYNNTITPKQPQVADYLNFMQEEPTNKPNLWIYTILDGSDGNRYCFYCYGLFVSNEYRYAIKKFPVDRYAPLEGKEIIDKKLSTQNDNRYVRFYSDGFRFTADTQSGVVNITATTGSESINLNVSARPVWYNDGNKAIIKPNSAYIHNFELVGVTQGQLNIGSNVINVTGFCNVERVNYNYNAHELLKEKWLTFSSVDGSVCGILYEQGSFRDAGVYIGNNYKKPSAFEYNTLNFGREGRIGDQNVIIYFSDGLMQLKLATIGYNGPEVLYTTNMYYNGVNIGNGYADIEHQPATIPVTLY